MHNVNNSTIISPTNDRLCVLFSYCISCRYIIYRVTSTLYYCISCRYIIYRVTSTLYYCISCRYIIYRITSTLYYCTVFFYIPYVSLCTDYLIITRYARTHSHAGRKLLKMGTMILCLKSLFGYEWPE